MRYAHGGIQTRVTTFVALRFNDEFQLLVLLSVLDQLRCPWPRIYLRVGDGKTIRERVDVKRGDAFNHMQRVTMKVAHLVEPALGVRIRDVNDKDIALPLAARVSHP